MKHIVLLAITGYQRYVSPHKGFCCAYRSYTGGRSCSALGYRAIRMRGVLAGVAVLRKRFERCAAAFAKQKSELSARRSQRGFCDLDCGCDLPSLDCCMDGLDVATCCDLPCDGCDWPKKKKIQPGDADAHTITYIPPPRKRRAAASPSPDAM